jgi:hypothetical protein
MVVSRVREVSKLLWMNETNSFGIAVNGVLSYVRLPGSSLTASQFCKGGNRLVPRAA